MPRPPYKKKSVTLRVTTSQEVKRYLEQLVVGGLYGPTAPEVAAVLISLQIQRFLDSGSLRPLEAEGELQ